MVDKSNIMLDYPIVKWYLNFMQNKNNNLTYWWNLPIDELEEMADENGKIKLERTNMSKEEMKANILKNIKEDNEYFNK